VIFLTSDEHHGHKNIIKYCNRPFTDVDDMSEKMIALHNATVSPGDVVYHLGDFTLDEKKVEKNLSRLNGEHHLWMGNHDACHPKHKKSSAARERYLAAGFKTVQEQSVVELEGLGKVLLCHMPLAGSGDHTDSERYTEWRPTEDMMVGVNWLLHGHIHEKWKLDVKRRMVNVGVDVWDYKPVSVVTLADFLNKSLTPE